MTNEPLRAPTGRAQGRTPTRHVSVRLRTGSGLRVGGAAGLTFDRVAVRIDPTSRLNVHMDTDEANACGLHLAKELELVK